MITKRDVQEAAEQLASEAWERREVPGELERSEEIQQLTRQQLHEDTYSTAGQRDRVGAAATGWIGHHDLSGHGDEPGGHRPVWPERTHDQLELESGMQPFLDALSADDRVLIRLVYDGGYSQREVAQQLGQSQPTVSRRLNAVHDQLRAALARAFLPEPEVTT